MRLTGELNFKRGGSRKKQYRGGNCLKRGELGHFTDLRWGGGGA